MKLVKGRTLANVFERQAAGDPEWSRHRVLGLLLRACEAIAYAHDQGVIHRDLKPDNVMVGDFGEVYVMDWGLARRLDEADHLSNSSAAEFDVESELAAQVSLTLDGTVVGTPEYMSPEQAAGRIAEMDATSDVYSIGAMLYQLLAGYPPYQTASKRVSGNEVLRLVGDGRPASMEQVSQNIPAELAAVCEKAMAREKSSRYASIRALAGDLAAFQEGRVVHAYETGGWAEARKWVHRNKPLATSLAAAVLAVFAGGVAFALKADEAMKAEGQAKEATERAEAKTREAEANLTLAKAAQANETEQRIAAEGERERAEAETAKVLRLSDVKLLTDLESEVDTLWPAYPEQIPALESWLGRARELAERLPRHRETLVEMRAHAHPRSDEERKRDNETHPKSGALAEKKAELERLIAQLDKGLQGEAQEKAVERVDELEPEVAALTEAVESRRTWTFETTEDQWQHDVLSDLVGNLEALEAALQAYDVVTPGHGWSVGKRMAFARNLAAGFAEGGEYAQAWMKALPKILEAYPGVDLTPQMGLLPVGPDPDSGLWEFAHMMTGEPARRGPDGKLILTEATGVVLVLIPPGSFWMGAQRTDPKGRNYDPQAQPDEGPVHEVALSAYFLSKYEMTQGQWKRLTGTNPSTYGLDGAWDSSWLASGAAATLLSPVEQVSWLDCMAWLPRAGLALPGEALWERGARAGSETVYWSGDDLASLTGVANLSDIFGKSYNQKLWTLWEPEFNDGSAVHWPVGTSLPNAFGLHDVHGNVWEWCVDSYDEGFYVRSPSSNPQAHWQVSAYSVGRGGSFYNPAVDSRSACRCYFTPSYAVYSLGVRPARAITE